MPNLKLGMCSYLTEDILQVLRKKGIKEVIDLVAADVEELAKDSGISYKELAAIRRLVLAQFSSFPMSGRDMYDDMMTSSTMLSTGCDSIDQVLDGGVCSCEVTEIFGSAASGKTQICLSTAVSVVTDMKQCVLYFDTGGSFDVERLHQFVSSRGLSNMEAEAAFNRLRCCPVFDLFELLSQIESLKKSLGEKPENFYCDLKLVVVDCVTSVISPILGGQQTDGHGYMMHLARALKSLALDCSVAILITNNVVQDPVNGTKPALGKTWLSVPNTRLEVKRPLQEAQNRVTSNQRLITLVKSSKQKLNQKGEFIISDEELKSS